MKQNMKVFHGSPIQDLRELLPNKSTHGRRWVYAAYDPVFAAAFLSNTGGDFTCAVGREPLTQKPFLCERFPRAFEYRYPNKAGSIYILEADGFVGDSTGWPEEAICPSSVPVLQEIRIPSIRGFLLHLQEAGRLHVYRFPNRPAVIPADDSDLAAIGTAWLRQGNTAILPVLNQHHPRLVAQLPVTALPGTCCPKKQQI